MPQAAAHIAFGATERAVVNAFHAVSATPFLTWTLITITRKPFGPHLRPGGWQLNERPSGSPLPLTAGHSHTLAGDAATDAVPRLLGPNASIM
jgi:hypothetical protein